MNREDDVQISVTDAARLLEVDRVTVWRYITLKVDPLPAIRIGHGYILWRSDVEAFRPRVKRKRKRRPAPPQRPPTPAEAVTRSSPPAAAPGTCVGR